MLLPCAKLTHAMACKHYHATCTLEISLLLLPGLMGYPGLLVLVSVFLLVTILVHM